MRRWWFNFCAGVSLLLCVAAGGMWVRGYWMEDLVDYRHEDFGDTYRFSNDRGRLVYEHYEPARGLINPEKERKGFHLGSSVHWNWYEGPGFWDRWRFAGFSCRGFFLPKEVAYSYTYRLVAVPWWFIMVGFGWLPVLWVQRLKRERRARRDGLCRVCGYDLRASKERCPECGTRIGVE